MRICPVIIIISIVAVIGNIITVHIVIVNIVVIYDVKREEKK